MNNLEKKITLLCGDPETGVRRSVKFVRSCLSHQWVVVVDGRMMYMVEASTAGIYSFVTTKYGQMSFGKATMIAAHLNVRLIQLGSPTRFHITPVLDI